VSFLPHHYSLELPLIPLPICFLHPPSFHAQLHHHHSANHHVPPPTFKLRFISPIPFHSSIHTLPYPFSHHPPHQLTCLCLPSCCLLFSCQFSIVSYSPYIFCPLWALSFRFNYPSLRFTNCSAAYFSSC
jgi:hypothetical protein